MQAVAFKGAGVVEFEEVPGLVLRGGRRLLKRGAK